MKKVGMKNTKLCFKKDNLDEKKKLGWKQESFDEK